MERIDFNSGSGSGYGDGFGNGNGYGFGHGHGDVSKMKDLLNVYWVIDTWGYIGTNN